MSFSVQSELKIPDLWYDLYARFLPGAAFVGALYWFTTQDPKTPSGKELVLLAVAGYLSALITQPLSSPIVWFLHRFVARRYAPNKDPQYVLRTAPKLAKKFPKEPAILDKMHGETAFFIQLAMLTLCLLLVKLIIPICSFTLLHDFKWYFFLVAGFSLALLGILVAYRRLIRAKERADLLSTKKRKKAANKKTQLRYSMIKNMGAVDRIIRSLLALVVLYLAGVFAGWLSIIPALLAVLAVILVLTSIIGFCPIYAQFNISTSKKKKRTKSPSYRRKGG